MQQRALAVVDNYLKKKGIEALIPPELMPYELRPVEQRKAIGQYLINNPDARDIKSSDDSKVTFWPTASGVSITPPGLPQEQSDKQTQYSGGAMIDPYRSEPTPDSQAFMPKDTNTLPPGANQAQFQDQARRLNLAPERPMLDTPKPTFDAQIAQQQEQLRKIYDFIYNRNRNPQI